MVGTLITKSFLIAFCLPSILSAGGAEPSRITSWSNTSTGDAKTVFQVKPSEKITFTVKAKGAEKYLWQVGKSAQKTVKRNSFNWTVPDKKGLWKIQVIATNKSQEQYVIGLVEGFEKFPWMAWGRRDRKTRKWVRDKSKREISKATRDGYYLPQCRKEWIVSTFLKTVKPGESIQKAIDAIPPEGGIVELLPGVHDVKETIRINKSNVAIVGTHNSEIRSTDPAKHIFSLNEKWEQKIQLKNITFKGFKVTSTYDKHGRNILVYGMRVDNLTIENLKDFSFIRGFVHMNWRKDSRGHTQKPRCEVLRIFNNIVRNSTMMSCGCWNSVVAYNHVSGKHPPGACYGMLFEVGNNHISIHHNYLENTGANGNIQTESSCPHIFDNVCKGSQAGIWLRGGGPANARVENNVITGATVCGIGMMRQGTLKNARINNNLIYDCRGYGIFCTEYGYGMRPGSYGEAKITNNIIYNCGKDGISVRRSKNYPTNYILEIRNNIIAHNKGYGIDPCKDKGSCSSGHNDIWNNAKGKYNSKVAAIGDISVDPLFAAPSKGDFHLKSKAGRWEPKGKKWVKDNMTSPCIDAGDPKADFSKEPTHNGGRVNMGAYGNMSEASKSPAR